MFSMFVVVSLFINNNRVAGSDLFGNRDQMTIIVRVSDETMEIDGGDSNDEFLVVTRLFQ